VGTKYNSATKQLKTMQGTREGLLQSIFLRNAGMAKISGSIWAWACHTGMQSESGENSPSINNDTSGSYRWAAEGISYNTAALDKNQHQTGQADTENKMHADKERRCGQVHDCPCCMTR
jgi:hypothetical protein